VTSLTASSNAHSRGVSVIILSMSLKPNLHKYSRAWIGSLVEKKDEKYGVKTHATRHGKLTWKNTLLY